MGWRLHDYRAGGIATLVALLLAGAAAPVSAADLLARGLEGWVVEGAGTAQVKGEKVPVWTIADGVLHCRGGGYGFLRNETPVGDFRLDLEYRFPKKGNSGIGIRTPPFTGVGGTRPSAAAWEVQLLTDAGKAPVRDSCCALYGQVAPREITSRPAGEWNAVAIECRGPRIVVRHNDTVVIDFDQTSRPDTAGKPLQGFVSLQNHGSEVEFRGIRLTALDTGGDAGE